MHLTLKHGFIFLPVFTLMLCSSCEPCSSGSDAEIAQCLRTTPKEDIQQDQEVRSYLSRHKVYISLTTSPTRISKILPVLQALDTEYVENIFLALPDRYRNSENYVIPAELDQFPKLKILRTPTDLGPIMKLLPAVLAVKSDPDAIVLTVDDDTGYPFGMVGQLIKATIKQGAASTTLGTNIDLWGIDRYGRWPEKIPALPDCYSGAEISFCDVVQGYAAAAYKTRWIDAKLMVQLGELDISCKMSDDLVISFALALQHIPRVSVFNKFASHPIGFSYNSGADALHLGSGSQRTSSASSTNAPRYQKCIEIMHNWTISN